MKKQIALLMICALFMSTLAGCDSFDFYKELFSKDTPVDATNENATPTPDAPEPEPFPLVVNGITIDKSPETIVSLSPALTEILFEFGEGDRLIGRSEYCNYPRDAKYADTVRFGSEFAPEAIISLMPDLLLLPSPISEVDRILLEREGIAAVVIPSPKSLDEFRQIYRVLGALLYGMFVGEDEGETVFSDITLACNNPDVISLGSFVYITENMSIATGDTLESAVLSCFGENLAAGGQGYVFDPTELLKKQPDIILLSNIYTVDDLRKNEHFAELDAIADDDALRVIFIDNAYFERPSSRIVKLVSSIKEQLAELKLPQ